MTTRPRTVMRIYFHVQNAELYEQILDVLEGVTPRVQAHPADWSADVDLTGALRYRDHGPESLAAVIRLRILAMYGVQISAGVGPSRIRRVRRFPLGSHWEPAGRTTFSAPVGGGFLGQGRLGWRDR
ncbi:hypothetical protein [Streptomyces sp. NPDC056452]|uniref:hypothetical protein n=1 Tax=Streptomyces sp. NPDC056452 TaxID=3345821 RepID=UPI003684C3DF